MSFPRYPKYKASGVEWLGEVPEHWGVSPLKYFAAIDSCGSYGVEPDSAEIVLPVATTAQIDTAGQFAVDRMPLRGFTPVDVQRYGCSAGDILIVKSSGSATNIISGKAGLVDELTPSFVFSNFLMRVRPDLRYGRPKFVYALLSSNLTRQRVELMCSTTTYPNLQIPNYISASLPVPPLPEQTAIAEFLDRETGKIDALVAEQRRLMELLKEKRQAVISHAVTKGLNPHAPMKPSGIEWLGDVPEHWNRTRIKRTARPGNKTFVDGDWIETPYITTEGVRLLQCGNVGTGVFEEQGFRYISEKTFASFDCTEVEPGNVLICRLQSSRTILAGRACLAPNLGVKMITSVDNCIVKPSKDFDPRYIVYQLSTNEYLSFVEVVARGGTRDRVSRSMLGNIDLVAPPVGEQKEIADFIENETAKFDALTAEAQRAIDLLQERRTALIAAAVTGQIDVRHQPRN